MLNDFKSDGFMLMLVIGVIVFVTAQSLFFMIRALKRGRQLGISRENLKNTIASRFAVHGVSLLSKAIRR